MGIYTAYDSLSVDAAIEGHMQTLKKLCVLELGPNVNSLVLSGSFGRGEGSVIIHRDGRIEPLRDYDVRLIVNEPVQPSHIDRIRSEFMRETGLGATGEHFSGEEGFSLTLEQVTLDQLSTVFRRDRDLRVFDHLHASRVIFGQEISFGHRFPAAEIPKVNGLRFLFQKMVGLVGHYDRLLVSGMEITTQTRRTLIYECDKTFVEICTALVLLAGAYVPSYQQRAGLFEEKWQAWFPDLAASLPNLAAQIKRATQEKLYPGSTTPLSPSEAFGQARAALLTVFRFYVRKLYGIDFGDEAEVDKAGFNHLRKALYRGYYRTAVVNWLAGRGIKADTPGYWLARRALNFAYHRSLRLKFARRRGAGRGRLVWECVRPGGSFLPVDIFLAAWCALSAIGEGADATMLRHADETLSRMPNVDQWSAVTGQWSVVQGSRFKAQGGRRAPHSLLATRSRIIQAYAGWEQS